MPDVSFYKLNAAFASLDKFDSFAKPDAFIEVSLWHNGEGFDAHFSSHGDQSFKLTWGEYKALKTLVKKLDKRWVSALANVTASQTGLP